MNHYLPWSVYKSVSGNDWIICIEDARGEEIIPWRTFDNNGTSFKRQLSKARLIVDAVNATAKTRVEIRELPRKGKR